MTYTFKLARRLAVSRHFTMLPVLLVFAACSGGDATAPEGSPAESSTADTEWRPRDLTPVAVRINPSSVTLETNQLIHFRAHGRTSTGDSVDAAVTWSTTGGTILPDGRFSAAAIGTYAVIGRNRVRGEVHVDTSAVVVVRRQLQLASVEVTPGSVNLTPGVSQTFTAIGRLPNGRSVPIGVNWAAAGGTIDAGGTYVAGDTAGTYQVIAANTAGTYADTATISISAPPSPPPPVPDPPPAPVLAKVTLLPATVTLAPSATKRFAAYGQTTTGDSVAVSVVFAATGGTMTSDGLYTAGPIGGTYRVIASAGVLADTSTVSINVPLSSGHLSGIAFGNFNTKVVEFSKPYTGVVKVLSPTDIYSYLDAARVFKMHVIVNLSGSPRNYKNPDGTFSLTLWKERVARFQGMDFSSYINDGTLLGNFLLDEPHDPTNWGGKAVTFAELEAMGQYNKQLWPKMTTFVRVHATWMKGYTWRYVDAAWAQYSARKGDVSTYLQSNVASAKALGLGLIVGLNTLDGGDGSSGIPGTYPGAYAMSAAEVKRYGITLASEPYACGFIMWRYDPVYLARSDIASAMLEVSKVAGNRASAPCRVH